MSKWVRVESWRLWLAMFFIWITLAWLIKGEDYYFSTIPFEVHLSPPIFVDPHSCAVDPVGNAVPIECDRLEHLIPGQEFRVLYHTRVNHTCDAMYEPWLIGPVILGPSNFGGIHQGHPTPKEGKWLSMLRTIPLHTPPGTYEWKVHTVACKGNWDEWSKPVQITVWEK